MRTVRLEGPILLRDIEGAHAALTGAVAEEAGVEVETAGLEACDLSFVQLLIAAQASARAAGGSFRLASPVAPALIERLTALRLHPEPGGAIDARHRFWSEVRP